MKARAASLQMRLRVSVSLITKQFELGSIFIKWLKCNNTNVINTKNLGAIWARETLDLNWGIMNFKKIIIGCLLSTSAFAQETLLNEMMDTQTYVLNSGDLRNTPGCPASLNPSAGKNGDGQIKMFFLNTGVVDRGIFGAVDIRVDILGRGSVVENPSDRSEYTGYVKSAAESTTDEVRAFSKRHLKIKLNGAFLLVGAMYRNFKRTVDDNEFTLNVSRIEKGILMDLHVIDKVAKIDSNMKCAYEAREPIH